MCTVDKVDESNRSCDVSPLDGGAMIYDVRLQASLDSAEGVCLIPAEGSQVIVTFINKQTGYVAACSSVDKVLVGLGDMTAEISREAITATNGGQSVELSQDGLKVKGFFSAVSANESNSLKTAIEELLDQLASAVVSTPSGPGTFDPAFISAIQVLKAKFATFLK